MRLQQHHIASLDCDLITLLVRIAWSWVNSYASYHIQTTMATDIHVVRVATDIHVVRG